MTAHQRTVLTCSKKSSLLALVLLIASLLISGCMSDGGGSSSGGSSSAGGGEPTDASITLSWVAPSARQDGSPISLSELAGYEIRYGTADGSVERSIEISDQSKTSAKIDLDRTGTYYFMVRTFDTEGRYSAFSERREVRI